MGHGPARAGHGHFRIDQWPLAAFAGTGPSVVAIEVAASAARSYYMVDQPAFLQASRGVPYPRFKMLDPEHIATGTFRVLPEPPKRRYYGFHPKNFGDFPNEELEARPDLLMSSLETTALDPGPSGATIQPGTFHLHDFGTNLSGFLGMLPMCYPADPYEGGFIPNWAMWFVAELEEYHARTGDRELVDRLRPKIEALFEYFTRFENSDGLLENLEEWVFVEWSEANKLVQDVNYPSNMLYAAALDTASRLYERRDWREKASVLRSTINNQSFDGTFFRDRAKRLPDGKLDIRPDRTEVCQYYAFFFGTATPESRPKLWTTLVEEFGPARRETKAHPEIHPCNQFPGNILRIEILSRHGETARIHDDALGYWNSMAATTGTLWENDKPSASCNHGFASHAAVVLRRDVLGLRSIDPRGKSIIFSMPDNPLQHCRGSFPTPDGDIVVEWKRDGSEPILTLPPGWRVVK